MRTGAQATKSLHSAANMWEWISSRLGERRKRRREGGGPDRVAFREEPVQPASSPASSRNTPWTASSCMPWKGHEGRGWKWIGVRVKRVGGMSICYHLIISCCHLNKLIILIFGFQVARLDLWIPPQWAEPFAKGPRSLFFFLLLRSSW